MNRTERLANSYLMRERPTARQSSVSSWAAVGGIVTTISVVQAALAARLTVQLFALDGSLANTVYSVGGFFQRPFEGYSVGTLRTRGIFEPETVLAMTAYAIVALVIASTIAMLRLSLHRPLWGAVASAAADVGCVSIRVASNFSGQASRRVAGLRRASSHAGAFKLLRSTRHQAEVRGRLSTDQAISSSQRQAASVHLSHFPSSGDDHAA